MVQIFPCRKIEIGRAANFPVILFLRLKFLSILEAKSWPEHITNVCSLVTSTSSLEFGGQAAYMETNL